MSSSLTPPDFPKILVATSFPPDVPGGSSWLLYQLLRGLQPAEVAWWTSAGMAPVHSTERVSKFKSARVPPRLVPHYRYTQIKSYLLETFWVPFAAAQLRRFIKAQKPDLVWVQASSWAIPVLHQVIPKCGVPWHITVHDLADSVGLVRNWGISRARRYQEMVDDLYAGATSRDVYMQETGDEMERVTGRKADLVIRCGAEPEELEYVRTKPIRTSGDKIRIGYPGTIVAEGGFVRFVEALQLLRKLLPVPVEINLFGIHSYRDRPWFDPSMMVEHGYLTEDELERRYRNCDWGLAIMELDDSNPRYSRFTFPCKFTRALAAALPIIAIGDPECTLTRFARQFQLGPVISETEPAAIAEALFPALSRPADSPQLRAEILRCAESEFNAEQNRTKLHALFCSAAHR